MEIDKTQGRKDSAGNMKYKIDLEKKYGFLELIDIPEIVRQCKDKWYNQTLCQVDDTVIRLGILHGEFHWHSHREEDEFFLVVDGRLLVDLEDETITIGKHQGYTVPKGVLHRTRAEEKTIVIMVSRDSVTPVGDQLVEYDV